ncbi:hypothetical protein [Paragemmobacter straminiformis]|uniref:Nucleotide-diphospho-sugar transferase n=1 Tax=Paragemmobacter straminiformis TaxID=2045119 RepID=A0A842I6F7_9RHOB|nr:hypothetical protein [Gemmobacter straminiformis]MBC2835229.1 hypothetical protein [Gemmobacter straminiformis]
MSKPRLTMFFIVEPPKYQLMACHLAASIRANFGDSVAMVGYCPAHRMAELSPDAVSVLGRMGCELRPMQTEGRFDPPYPHGNKMLAALERRETEYSCFLDSDILFLRPNSVENLISAGKVSLTPAASMGWAGQDIWPVIYAAAGLGMPAERIRLMNQRKGADRMPYFSSGLFCFPENHVDARGMRFAEVWMEVAAAIDAAPDVPAKRPYLDQMTLPLAIRKAGLDWNILPKEQHWILGGMKRGQPLPKDREIFTVHYRNWDIVKEYGLSRQAKDMLQAHAGVRRMAQIGKGAEAAE